MSVANAQGPEMLMQLMQGAQASGIYKASVELDVYSKIAAGAKTAAAVAKTIECPERSTRILLDACAALGLLQKNGSEYGLTPTTELFLVRGTPMYMGDLVQLFGSPTMWNAAQRFTESVRNGGTVLAEHAETPGHGFWETFARSTAAMAGPAALALDGLVGSFIAGRPKVRVLDIAAGSGIYGFTLAKHPNVELTVLDWPNVIEETKQWAARLGVDAARVRYLPGNLFELDYQGPYDLILLSHVYHHFDASTCESLTRKVAAALAPGGRVAIHEFLYDAKLDNPMGALFSTTMLMWTKKGEAYSADDYQGWLGKAGLRPLGVHASMGMPTSFVLAEK